MFDGAQGNYLETKDSLNIAMFRNSRARAINFWACWKCETVLCINITMFNA